MTSTDTKDETHVLSNDRPKDFVCSRDVQSPSTKRTKRRPPRKPFTRGNGKTILPTTSKTQLNNSYRLTSPLLDIQPIFISTYGLVQLCQHLHDNLKIRDRQMTHITSADMTYTALIAVVTKILRCDAAMGFVDSDLAMLEATMKDVLFPSILADYIDSVGFWTMKNGITVSPSYRFLEWKGSEFSESNPSYIKQHFLHPGLLSSDSGVPDWYVMIHAAMNLPIVAPAFVTHQKWCLMPDVIQRYRRVLPRMSKSVDLRIPSPTCEGQQNILVCRKTENVDTIHGYAPERMPEEIAQLGAVFGWNTYETFRSWPGDQTILSPWTVGMTFSLTNVLARLVQTLSLIHI